MNVAILVDYDNLLPTQKAAGLMDVAIRVLMQLPKVKTAQRGSCDLRLYGGWYEGASMTKLAQELSSALQVDFPAIVRVPTEDGGQLAITVSAALAMSMIEEPSHHLLNTFRKKGKPNNVRVQKQVDVGCSNVSCILPMVKKLLASGSCPVASCTIPTQDLLYRNEQKTVDTMLTCDLIYAQHQRLDNVVLVSGDDDFIPPVRTLLLRGTTITRVHPKPNAQRQKIVVGANRLIELEL
jgi:uncharacterized LabA/DUF88 family protein